MPKQELKELTIHGDTRVDPYYWMNQRDHPDVLAFLKEENAHQEASLKHTKPLQESLFEEMKGRIKKEDQSVPYPYRDYEYYSRMSGTSEYPIVCRRKKGSEEEICLIDVNELAKGHAYYQLGEFGVSPSQNLLAFSVDQVGRRIFSIFFKDLTTNQILSESISNVTGNMAWAADDRTLFYTKQDPETLRSDKIFRHTLGTDSATDTLVYEETDPTFDLYVYRTLTEQHIVLYCQSTLTTEVRLIDTQSPEQPPVSLSPEVEAMNTVSPMAVIAFTFGPT